MRQRYGKLIGCDHDEAPLLIGAAIRGPLDDLGQLLAVEAPETSSRETPLSD